MLMNTKLRKLEMHMKRKSPIKRGIIKVIDEDKPLEDYSKMTNRIYLGNEKAAQNKKFFKEKKIRAVLNCSKDIDNFFEKDPKIEYMRIPIDDSLKEVDFKKFYNFIPVISEFIYKHADIEKHNIFIHCAQGRQRSIASFCAYLMSKKNLSTQRAMEYSLKKRLEAFHYGNSINFDKPLLKYEQKLIKQKKCLNIKK
jgi:protein-tyrosine phosphatase